MQRRANGSGMGPLLGRYELLMRVGSGGMGTVWAARQRGTRGFQKMVALKTILPMFSTDPQYQRLFMDEARLTAQVRHPNVAQILDLGEDNGLLYLAMEWIEGVSLAQLLRGAEESGVPIPLSVAIRIATQVAAGLHAAHELRDPEGELVGLVHRDVSPQNILVSFDGITKVIDFGIAKVVRDGGEDATRSFQVKGKVGYLAPEQIMDASTDRRVDVFALGIVLYVLTVGAHPFEGRGPLATLYNITQEPVTPPSKIHKDFPGELEAIILKCLEKDRARRFASCDELVWALESSIPSDLRGTDQDVAVFVRSVAGDLGAERLRALELAAAEPASITPSSFGASHDDVTDDEVPGDGMDDDEVAVYEVRADGAPESEADTDGKRNEPRAEGSAGSLVVWAAVFAVSVWILIMEWRVEPLAPPESVHAAARPAVTCPAPVSSSPGMARTQPISNWRVSP